MPFRNVLFCCALAAGVGANLCLAQSADLKQALQPKLNSQFVITKMTADGSDVVTAGSIVTLHKDGLQMCSIQARVPIGNTYKEGKLSTGRFAWGMEMGLAQPSLPIANVPMRSFVSGEKFWVTALGVVKNEVVFNVVSDAYGDNRYYTQIAFPFNKKNLPTADEAMRIIGEVLTAESPQPAEAAAAPAPPATPAPPPEPAPQAAPTTLPPPPPDAAPPPPPTVSLGQTEDQVVAVMGKPKSIGRPTAARKIYVYDGLKVIFVNGKVSDVQ